MGYDSAALMTILNKAKLSREVCADCRELIAQFGYLPLDRKISRALKDNDAYYDFLQWCKDNGIEVTEEITIKPELH